MRKSCLTCGIKKTCLWGAGHISNFLSSLSSKERPIVVLKSPNSNKMKLRKFKLILNLGLGRLESFTYEEAKELIEKRKVGPFDDFISKKAGKPFSASLYIKGNESIGYRFAKK